MCVLYAVGIAQVAAQQGFNVTLIDVNASSLGDAKKRIGDSIGRVAKKKFANDNVKFLSLFNPL